jgi:hypothetical protein
VGDMHFPLCRDPNKRRCASIPLFLLIPQLSLSVSSLVVARRVSLGGAGPESLAAGACLVSLSTTSSIHPSRGHWSYQPFPVAFCGSNWYTTPDSCAN